MELKWASIQEVSNFVALVEFCEQSTVKVMEETTVRVSELVLAGLEMKVSVHLLRVLQSHLESRPTPGSLRPYIEMVQRFLLNQFTLINFDFTQADPLSSDLFQGLILNHQRLS